MSSALSVDLRIRVLAAVGGSLSHGAAGERFGVSAASVSRWRALGRSQGDARPKALGGNRRSGRVDACKSLTLSLLSETPDITIEEIAWENSTMAKVLTGHKRKSKPILNQCN
jgi:transposase